MMGGADPGKLQRQIAAYGRATSGMPRLLVFRASDGELVIYDGVTRATRVAKLLPKVTVEVEGDRKPRFPRKLASNRGRSIAMISDQRRELLRLLAELSEETPDVRFGQLIANLSYLGRGLSAESVWNVEDNELLRAAREHLELWRARNKTGAAS
jgi:hypothetical protein